MKAIRNLLPLFAPALAVAAAVTMSGCGGGGGGGASGTTTPTPTGSVNVQITDGPSDEFQHVWVTINSIAFHTSADQVWNASDATWQKFALPAPVTVDLSTLNNGALNSLFSGLTLPTGTYHQIRFFFDGAEASLDASALATKDSNGAALQWNDQVEYLNAHSSYAITEAPLEIAYPTQGIQLQGAFAITAGSTLSLAVDFDLEHIIVPFNHGGMTYFTMKPNLAYYDMSKVGAITGTINPAQLCQTASAEITQSPTCAYNLIIKAERLTADGTRHFDARATTVDPVTGKFTLYPLATQDASGNAITSYDVLIRGRNTETMIVTGVPVTTATAPGGTGSAAPTSLQSTAVVLTLNPAEYTAQFATPLSPLSSGHAIFQQTLPNSTQPYEVRWRNTDPFTGMFHNPIPLQGASSMLHVASYNGGNTLAFASVVPVEGQGAFTVADNEVVYYGLSTGAVMMPPSSGTTQTFVPGAPALVSGVQSGTINVNLSFSGIANDDSCSLVVSRFAAIIDADTMDCSTLISTAKSNGGTSSGSFSLTGVPSGVPGAYYYAYVRVWNSAHPAASKLIVPLAGFIDLRTQSTQTLNGSIPGA